jgi:CMP-N,N'-diacetyllegionaminic acid synthase
LKSLCFIAAQGKTNGVKSTNVKQLAGKPLISYTIESAINSDLFNHVIVSTENDEIAQISEEFGAELPFKRPKNLASFKTGMDDVLSHGINELNSLGYEFDTFVNRDCTVPFIRNKDIGKSIKFLKRSNSDAVFGTYKPNLNPYFNMMELKKDGFLQFSKKKGQRPKRHQIAPPVFQVNGLFVYDARKFLKSGKLIPKKTLPFAIPPWTAIKLDTDFEFNIAESMIMGIDKLSTLIHEL